jgi:hypothetical protein
MRLSTIALAVMLSAGTAPSLGSSLADGGRSQSAKDASTSLERTRQSARDLISQTQAQPSTADGFEIADETLGLQQRRATQSPVQGLDEILREHQSYVQRVQTTVSLVDDASSEPVEESDRRPSQAALRLAEEAGEDLDATQRADLAHLDELPAPWPAAIAEWIDRFISLHVQTEAALSDVTLDEEPEVIARQLAHREDTEDLPQALAGPESPIGDHLPEILDARDAFLEASLSLRDLAREEPLSSQAEVEACPVLAAGLANEDTTYTEHCRLILDLGGSDEYRNNAGGNAPHSLAPPCPWPNEQAFAAAALVDLADGGDTYGNPENPDSCGVAGGGHSGSGFLLDAAGSDSYHAGAWATGATDLGTGTLVDLAGHDSYQVDQAANGGAVFGASLLYDAAGADVYAAPEASVTNAVANGGGVSGQGALVDAAGNDHYIAGNGNGGGGVGSGFLLDVGGDDRYDDSAGGGTNGGSFAGSGLLVDLRGNDTFQTEDGGTNGGGELGAGALVNIGGDDAYRAGSTATNGGGSFGGLGLLLDDRGEDRYEAGNSDVNGGASLAQGLLLDARGHDRYEDREGGTGTNKTVAPKGQVGAQVDLAHPPSEPSENGDTEPPDAPDERPHVTVGVPDTGINPYHEAYHRPNLTAHPCTYIPDFPCDVPALNLTLDAGDLETAIREDLDVWKSVEPDQWYWIPGTSIVAVSCEDDGAPCFFSCSIEALEERDELECGHGSHGTHSTSSALAENPEALIAFREASGQISAFEDRGIPVDIYSVSWGLAAPTPIPSPVNCGSPDIEPMYVTSAGNDPRPTVADCWAGDPAAISVGGAYAQDRSEEGDAAKTPEVVTYYCRPTADASTLDGYEEACGTSFAAPTVAGALSKTLLDVREHTGYTGNRDGSLLDPTFGDDGLAVGDLRDAMNRTATYDPEPRYDNTDTGGSVPLNPAAPWIQWGWGFYDGWVAEDTTDHLLEEPAPPKPGPDRAYMEAQHTAKTLLFGDRTQVVR